MLTTAECQDWARAALSYRKAKDVTLQSAINSLRPASATESDYFLALSLATVAATASDKREVTSTYDPLRESVAQQNRDALVAVLNETGITLNAQEYNKWRPTQRVHGVIPGMPVRVTCVATDGNLGLFLPDFDQGHNLGTAFLGHVHRFEWSDGEELKTGAPGPLFSVPKTEITDKKPKKTRLSRKDKLAML